MNTTRPRGLGRPVAWLATLLALAPFALLATWSVARSWRYPALLPTAWQFDQWQTLGEQGAALAGAGLRSAWLALLVATCATLIGFVTSHTLARHPREQRWMGLALLCFALPPVVFAASLGQAFAALGLGGRAAGVALAQLPFASAYALVLCRGYWTPHSFALGEVAMALGARPSQRWWRVHLPLARGVLGLCLFQTALMSWFDVALVRMIGAGQVETLSLKVFDTLNAGDLRQAAAAALLLLAPPCAALCYRPRLLWPALTTRPPS
ncbi:MAG: ABC transporter permease [Proteobacteria bacterium]|jgi:putative spermidine/putrescine transport system permease protein|nr:ABC transporter permease [Pseudomonadota bacterium]